MKTLHGQEWWWTLGRVKPSTICFYHSCQSENKILKIYSYTHIHTQKRDYTHKSFIYIYVCVCVWFLNA